MLKTKVFIFFMILGLAASQTQGRPFTASPPKGKTFSVEFIQNFFSLDEETSSFENRLKQIKSHSEKTARFFKQLISHLKKSTQPCFLILRDCRDEYDEKSENNKPYQRLSITIEKENIPNAIIVLEKLNQVVLMILNHLKTIDYKTLPVNEDERTDTVWTIAEEIGEKTKHIFDDKTMHLYDEFMAQSKTLI